MIRLVYASTLAPGTTVDDVDLIVRHSAGRNREAGITGMLAVEGSRVCQVLEGSEEAVTALYGRIETDERHEGVVELDRHPIAERRYREWAMVRRPMIDIVTMAFAE